MLCISLTDAINTIPPVMYAADPIDLKTGVVNILPNISSETMASFPSDLSAKREIVNSCCW